MTNQKITACSTTECIAILVAITVLVGTLIEFQWKTSVAVSFATNEDQMTRYFGFFHAAVNLVTGLIQVLLTGRLVHRLGTRTSLLVLPMTLLASTLGVLFASVDRVVLTAITRAKGCNVVKRSINDPAILMLYTPLSNGPRRQAITFVSGIVKPSAEAVAVAVAALLIISFAGIVSTRSISYVALALLCVWLFVASVPTATKQALAR
jgi:ATP/ADP translocase